MISYIVILFLISNVSCIYLKLPRDSPCEFDGLPGKCVSSYQCLTAAIDVASRKHPHICSFEDHDLVICCTDCTLVKDVRLIVRNPVLGNLFKTGTSKAADKCVDYLHTLDYKCREGLKPLQPTKKMVDIIENCSYEGNELNKGHGFAVGGGNASRGEFPHMALLGYGDTIETAQWKCGGSVISERYILTAGHCMYSRKMGRVKFIALGILKRSDPPSLWQTYNVQTFIKHPHYRPPLKYNDIALVKTDREIVFSPQVLPACLHVEDNDEYTASATGWGAVGYHKGLADVLQSVLQRKYTINECLTEYQTHRHYTRGLDPTTQLCYGDIADQPVPTDTCKGYSGGPLQYQDSKRCVYMILGITSFGRRRCGDRNSVSLYTRVRHFVPWIESIVWP